MLINSNNVLNYHFQVKTRNIAHISYRIAAQFRIFVFSFSSPKIPRTKTTTVLCFFVILITTLLFSEVYRDKCKKHALMLFNNSVYWCTCMLWTSNIIGKVFPQPEVNRLSSCVGLARCQDLNQHPLLTEVIFYSFLQLKVRLICTSYCLADYGSSKQIRCSIYFANQGCWGGVDRKIDSAPSWLFR